MPFDMMPEVQTPVEISPQRANMLKFIHELRHGKTFAHTSKKFGKSRAEKQMVAIELSNERNTTAGAIHREMMRKKK